jgi:hypothetical protein
MSLNESLKKYYKNFSDNRIGFTMMRFNEHPRLKYIYTIVKQIFKDCGVEITRSDEYQADSEISVNIKTHLRGCDFGIAIFDGINNDAHNPNMAIEIGYLLALEKKICILKDSNISLLPADIGNLVYFTYDSHSSDLDIKEALYPKIKQWLKDNELLPRDNIEIIIRIKTDYLNVEQNRILEFCDWVRSKDSHYVIKTGEFNRCEVIKECTNITATINECAFRFITSEENMQIYPQWAGLPITAIFEHGRMAYLTTDFVFNIKRYNGIEVHWCGRENFRGYEDLKNEIDEHLPKRTRNKRDICIYITKTNNDFLYCQSNYINTWSEPNSVKLMATFPVDFLFIYDAITYDGVGNYNLDHRDDILKDINNAEYILDIKKLGISENEIPKYLPTVTRIKIRNR